MTDWLETALTPREEEMVALMFRGVVGVKAAELLGISHETVRRHEANIRLKLGVRNSLEIVTLGYRQGAMKLWE